MRSSDSEAGFTIIEVLVAALITAVMASGIALALSSAEHASGDQRMHAEADALATQDQERMRGLSDEQLATLGGAGQNHTETADGFQFTVNSRTAAVSAQGISSCTSGTASDYQITSTVSWTTPGGSDRENVRADSLMARPTTGDLLTVVDDQTGQPLPGVSIATTAGPSSASGTTDANGCSLFAGLTPGGYTIAASETGYVDPTGNPTPTLSPTVNETGTATTNTFKLGLGGTITATFAAVGSGAGEANQVSDTNVGNATPVATAAAATPPALAPTSITTGLLYPVDTSPSPPASYQNNYTVWAGGCPQEVPPAPKTASVSPGSAQNVTITEPALLLSSVKYNNAAVTPSSLKLTFSSLSGTSCTDTWSAAVASATSPGVPPTTGWLADPGLPYADGTTGELTVCASYVTPSHATVSGQVSTANSNPNNATAIGPINLTRSGGC